MIKIYGSMLCPDCVQCCADLDRVGIPYEYLDFGAHLGNLKEFLLLRDRPEFDPIRSSDMIGIPCILLEDGTITFSWDTFME